MARKLYKAANLGDGKRIEIFGSNRDIQTYIASSEDYDEVKFRYRGRTYKLSDFINIHNKIHHPNPPEWMLEFDGYLSDGYYSGILVKVGENLETVRAYTYIS